MQNFGDATYLARESTSCYNSLGQSFSASENDFWFEDPPLKLQFHDGMNDVDDHEDDSILTGPASSSNSFVQHEKAFCGGAAACQEFESKPRKGCQCRKILCNKMYCSCFKEGRKCTKECLCIHCDNHCFKKFMRTSIEDFSLMGFNSYKKNQLSSY